jgi:hypothetical protein
MIHKISQLCDKIDGLKKDADRLRQAKYGTPKRTTAEIDSIIAQIQADCLLISQDKTPYEKIETQ